jgi:hypothetical protein
MKNLQTDTVTIKKQIAFRPKGWAYAEAFLQAAKKYRMSESQLARECIEAGFALVTERLEKNKQERQSVLERTRGLIFAMLGPRSKQLC